MMYVLGIKVKLAYITCTEKNAIFITELYAWKMKRSLTDKFSIKYSNVNAYFHVSTNYMKVKSNKYTFIGMSDIIMSK